MKFQGFVLFFQKMLTQGLSPPPAVTREKKTFRAVDCLPSLPGIEPAPIHLPIDPTNWAMIPFRERRVGMWEKSGKTNPRGQQFRHRHPRYSGSDA